MTARTPIICASTIEKDPALMASNVWWGTQITDYVEMRLDCLEPGKIKEALDPVRKQLGKVICTIRSPEEGGLYTGTEEERIRDLEMVAGYRPAMLDVEYETLEANRGLFARLGTRLLVSKHIDTVPPIDYLRGLASGMKQYGYAKIACRARTKEEAGNVMKLYTGGTHNRLVAFCTGKAGADTRIHSQCLGAPFTYACLMDPVEEGQRKVGETRDALMHCPVCASEKRYGISG